MRKVEIVYEGYIFINSNKVKTDLVIVGDVVKETKLQIVVKDATGTLHFINKKKIKKSIELEGI